MSCPEPQAWCAIINRTSRHLAHLEKAIFKSLRFKAHTSLHMLRAACWNRPRALGEMRLRPELSLAGVKSVRWLAHFAGRGVEPTPLPPHSAVSQYAVHLAEPLKDLPPGMWLLLLWETEWIIVQDSACQTSTGNNFFSVHDRSCRRYCYANVNQFWIGVFYL